MIRHLLIDGQQAIPVRPLAVDARLTAALRGHAGRVQVSVTEVGRRGGEHTSAVIVSDGARRELIRALGGVPADETVPFDGDADGRCWYCGQPVDVGATAFYKDRGGAPMHGTCPRDLP